MVVLWHSVRELENQNARYTGNQLLYSSQMSDVSINDDSGTYDTPSGRLRRSSMHLRVSDANRTAGATWVNQKVTRAMATQGSIYVLAFLVTYILMMVHTIYTKSHGIKTFQECIICVDFFCLCSVPATTRFWNGLVFVRLREMYTPEGRFFKTVFCPWLWCRSSSSTSDP